MFLLFLEVTCILLMAYGVIYLFKWTGAPAARIVWTIAVVAIVLVALDAFGVLSLMRHIPVPQVR